MSDEPIVVTPADLIAAYRETFSTSAGQIVIKDLMRKFGFTLRPTRKPGETNDDMNMNEGSRRVLIYIGVSMEMDPNLAEEMHNAEY